MLSACMIFGKLAGESAADWTGIHKPYDRSDILAQTLSTTWGFPCGKKGTVQPRECLQVLQKEAWEHALVIRTKPGLMHFRETIARLREELTTSVDTSTSNNLIKALELRNLLLVGDAVALAAFTRNESRGGHYREDWPNLDKKQVAACMIHHTNDESLQIHREVIDPDWTDTEADLGGGRWG